MRWIFLFSALVLSACATAPADGFVHIPLRGAHAALGCSDCHGQDLQHVIPSTCIGCHVEDAPPAHYSGDCGNCHNEDSWAGGAVDHSFFALEGGHAGPTCTDCHGDAPFADASPVCESCHSRPDPHAAGTCDTCHTIFSWQGASVDHSFFPLTNGHSGPTCTDCHGSAPYTDASAVCESCHSRPNGHFNGACETCHTTVTWQGATVDHSFFPLTNGHSGPTCTDCHGSAPYSAASPVCESCHSRPFFHASGACDNCHNHRNWDDADDD